MNIKQYDDLINLVELEIKNSIIVYDFKELIDLDIDQIDDYIAENYDNKYRVLKVQLAYKYHIKVKWAFLLKKYREDPLYNQKTYSQLLKCVDKESKSKKGIRLCVLKNFYTIFLTPRKWYVSFCTYQKKRGSNFLRPLLHLLQGSI